MSEIYNGWTLDIFQLAAFQKIIQLAAFHYFRMLIPFVTVYFDSFYNNKKNEMNIYKIDLVFFRFI